MKKLNLKNFGFKDVKHFLSTVKTRDKLIGSGALSRPDTDYTTNEKAARRHPDSQEFRIGRIIERSDDVRTYRLKKADGSLPAPFLAGQYVVVRQIIDGKLIARPISISSSPKEAGEGYYDLTVKRMPNGFLSGWILDHWKEGDPVTTSGPQGVFCYDELRDRKKVIAAAGGSGITPILSMASSVADGTDDYDLTVLYGIRTRSDALFFEEFAEILSRSDRVKLIPVYSEEEVPGAEHGFITAELIRKYAGEEPFSLFAAGPQGLYRFLDREAEKLGLEPRFYRKEIFGITHEVWKEKGYPAEARGKTFTATVRMCGQVHTIPVSADEPILIAFERAGIAGPNRCRGGICGWCRSRLLSGRVFIPEETDGRRSADREWNYIHPCASFALSDIVLEVPLNK